MAQHGRLASVGTVVGGRRGPLCERIVKTAIAATVAWEAGRLVPDNPQPYLAPLIAVLVMQPTIAQSISYPAQRAIGVVIGIAIATLAIATVGVHGWSIGLVVLVSLAVGTQLCLGPIGIQQVAVGALLVLILGSTGDETAYALHRGVDTIVGTLVGLAMNSFLAPPSHLPQAQTAVRSLEERTALVLDALATSLADGITRRQAEGTLAAARSPRRPRASATTRLAAGNGYASRWTRVPAPPSNAPQSRPASSPAPYPKQPNGSRSSTGPGMGTAHAPGRERGQGAAVPA